MKFKTPALNYISCLSLLSTTMAVLFLSGCWNRGRQFSSGNLELKGGQQLELRDRNGDSISFGPGPVELDYQDKGVTRDTSLFVLRSKTSGNGVLFEIPNSSFRTDADFNVKAKSIGQKYDLKGERKTEHLGSRVYQTTEGCTAVGFCCQPAVRTTTDSNGKTTTESYTDCGTHFDCPGNRDVELQDDHFKDHFYIHFIYPGDAEDAAKYHGQGEPYITTTKLRNLSSCRT